MSPAEKVTFEGRSEGRGSWAWYLRKEHSKQRESSGPRPLSGSGTEDFKEQEGVRCGRGRASQGGGRRWLRSTEGRGNTSGLNFII